MRKLKVLWVSPETHRKILKIKADQGYVTVDDAVKVLLKSYKIIKSQIYGPSK